MTLDGGVYDFSMTRQIADLQRRLSLRREQRYAGIVVTADGGVAFDADLAAEAEYPHFYGCANGHASPTVRSCGQIMP